MNTKSIEKLRKELETLDLTDYKSIPFWSWNNDLDEKELVKQIDEMYEAGIGGFIMHARTGLKIEYLGEKWFSCIDACLKKARELHMNAWVYDENGWPSGFVGGKLLENPDYLAQFLTYEVKDRFDSDAFCVFEKTESGYVRIQKAKEGLCEYHCVYLITSPANTDILNPEVVDEFIRQTHEEYYKRFADSFGKELVGFFTDEPQYYRAATPYTRCAAAPYLERYGEDIRDGLVYLFLHDKNGYVFRQRYYKLLNELYVNNFYKKLYDWCEAHNCKLTGHSVQEYDLAPQMEGGAGVMPTYEYEHIPGVDALGRECKNEQLGKQVGSVASQFGTRQVLTETFGCSGYDVTPKELKSITEFQYFNGVNLMCQHLLPYSIASQGKCDHPPVFSKHGNWWEEFKTFNDYFTKLGYLIANTDEIYDVLVIHPLRDIYLHYVKSEGRDSCPEAEQDLNNLIQDLRRRGILFQFADESILERHGKIDGDSIVIGKCRYNTVLLPNMQTISAPTLDLLQKFTGKLCTLGTPKMIDGVPSDIKLTPNITLEDIQKNAYVSFSCADGLSGISARSSELGDYLFLKNYSHTDNSSVTLKNVAEHYKELDLDTFELKNISNELTLEKCSGMVLIKDSDAKDQKTVKTTENITNSFSVTDITDNYLVLDMAKLSYDGISYGELLPMPRIFEDLLRADYKGMIYVKQSFEVSECLPLTVMLEKEKYTSVTLNGKELRLQDSAFDVKFVEADISNAVKKGKNELVWSIDYYQHDGVHFALFDPMATESLRNCLYYDTNIENTYIKGDFVLDEALNIHPRTSMPPVTSELRKNGYPFFFGNITLSGKYDFDGKDTHILSLDSGRFLVANVWVNDKKTDIILDTKKDITHLLKIGENDIKIVLKSSPRNLFGPHHWKKEEEPIKVNPAMFTMRGSWNGDISPKYTFAYNSVPFGVDEITIIHCNKT